MLNVRFNNSVSTSTLPSARGRRSQVKKEDSGYRDTFEKSGTGICYLLKNLTVSETHCRIQAMHFAFGYVGDHFCQQVEAYILSLKQQEKSGGFLRVNHFTKDDEVMMVRHLMRVVTLERLSKNTLHLAVYLMYRYFDQHALNRRRVWVAVLTCLAIAAKSEERKATMPAMRKLRQYIPPGTEFSSAIFTKMEADILKFFDWSILVPTSYSFMEFFELFIVDDEDYAHCHVASWIAESGKVPYPSVRNVRWAAFRILDVLLLAKPDERYLPSLVAAGAVMLARKKFGFYLWPRRLEFVTRYSCSVVKACCDSYVTREVRANISAIYKDGNSLLMENLDAIFYS